MIERRTLNECKVSKSAVYMDSSLAGCNTERSAASIQAHCLAVTVVKLSDWTACPLCQHWKH